MSSLRTRRASEFPKSANVNNHYQGLGAVPELPEIAVHHVSSGANPALTSSVGSLSRPSGVKRTPTYVKRADVQAQQLQQQQRGRDGEKDKRRMSRVGEKIKKRLSMSKKYAAVAIVHEKFAEVAMR
ncbi:hypothetical protein QFC21_004215 [Naganishia friedmannii]|uniref:Uncharacterized protein n=1 Tax=Naganishia friedmannii TaxID=89922 RepID=A0ACC2VJJ9_9TREE|nr:hypothetical protein QFC21_004215 [Naganishia friedmannii]